MKLNSNFTGKIDFPTQSTPIQSTVRPEIQTVLPSVPDENEDTDISTEELLDTQQHAKSKEQANEVEFNPSQPPGSLLAESYPKMALPHVDDEDPTGPLETHAQRLGVMSQLTQFDQNIDTPSDDSRCGASAITGLALLDGGREGLHQLLGQLQNYNQTLPEDQRLGEEIFREMSERFSDQSELRFGDISRLQDLTYEVLHREQNDYQQRRDPRLFENPPRPALPSTDGLRNNTLNRFIGSQPELQAAFRRQQASIHNVDMDGSNPEGGGHYVLSFGDHNQRNIYDSFPRQDQRQIVTEPAQVQLYLSAQATRGGLVYSSQP